MNYIDKIARAKRGEAMILNPGPHAGYAAISPNGDIVAVTDSRQDALNSLSGEVWVDDEDGEPELVENPAVGDNPRRALEVAGLEKIDFDYVMKSISLDEAHRVLFPYFALLQRKRGRAIQAYQTPLGMAEAFLGQNYKTAKETPGDPSLVMGLTLLPADRLTTKYPELDPSGDVFVAVNKLLRTDKARSIAAVHERLTPQKQRQQWTLCAGSNDQCKNSCLVYTGRNVADEYNVRRKAVGTMSLLEHPEHFIRMLAEAITLHSRAEVCRKLKPYVRLNVLSDVPWELLVPGMFDHFADYAMPGFSPVQFYDYTKVANRKPPPNYDLTFSFSGTNEALARAEIARGRRVAVVFLAMRPKGGREKWETFRFTGKPKTRGGARPQVDLPETFWNLPVIDGDENDIRPRNPAPCIVGLRWKTPAGKRVDPTATSFSFVTRVFHVSGEIFEEHDEPAAQSLRHSEYLAVPVTPRYQPVDLSDET